MVNPLHSLLLGLLTISFCHQSAAQDWRPVPDSIYLFDASTIRRMSPTMIRVWNKYVLIEESLQYMRKKGLADQYEDYAYSVALSQIDCRTLTHGFVNITNYNSRGAQRARR